MTGTSGGGKGGLRDSVEANATIGISAAGPSDIKDGDDGFSVVSNKRAKGGGAKGGNSMGMNKDTRDGSGLLSNRQRGFSTTKPNTRIPTSNLNDMQAKEGALVSNS